MMFEYRLLLSRIVVIIKLKVKIIIKKR